MTTFTQEQYNFAHLVMYVGKNGPRVLKKYLIDELFRWQLLRHQVHLMENLSQSKYALIFPNDTPVSSLDKLDDAVVFDVSKLVLSIEDMNDTQVLRRCLNTELEKTIFCKFMQDNEEKFRKKNKQRKLFSRKQMDELFPPGDSISIDKLDITAFCFIIFEGLNFMKPNGGLEKFPDDRDSTPGSDILRIKVCRNMLSHNPNDEISESDFKNLWEYMTTAFERLTEDVTYRQEGDRLRCVRPHMGIMDRLQAILEKWHEDDRAERSDHLETITEKIACSRDHTDNFIRDSEKRIISAVKKYTKHKSHKARSRWHQVCIKDLEKFKELCEREGLQYNVPEDSSTETDWSSSDSSQRSNRSDNTPRPLWNTSTYTDTYSDTRSFKDARANTALRDFDHHDGINRVQMDEQVMKPQLTEASQIRQRRGYVFNEQDEAQLSECEVQYAGTSIYTGTNTISSGYYTATGSSAYGNTERGENNSAFYFDDNEKEAPGTSDYGYASSGYSARLGKRGTYPQHGHHPFVQSTEIQDINTYGFIPSSQNDSQALYTTVPEPDTDEMYTDIGTFHRIQSRNRKAHSRRNGLCHLLCLTCILSQEKEEDPQPIVNIRSRNLAVPRRNHQQQNQHNESSQESPSEINNEYINNEYITLQLNDPYAVYSIA